MNEFWADYFANIITTTLLANGKTERTETLRNEHEKILKKLTD